MRQHQAQGLDTQWIFLTNNFALPALTITELYRCRCQVELFFKWIKQHLRIKAFFGTSEKRRQIANLDRRLRLHIGGHRQKASAILQILGLKMFEKIPLDQRLAQPICDNVPTPDANQLILFT